MDSSIGGEIVSVLASIVNRDKRANNYTTDAVSFSILVTGCYLSLFTSFPVIEAINVLNIIIFMLYVNGNITLTVLFEFVHSRYGKRFINDDVQFKCCDHVHDNDTHYNYYVRRSVTLHKIGYTGALMSFYGDLVFSMSLLLIFSGVRVTRSSFMSMFCGSLFVPLFFSFWPLCCLAFEDYDYPSSS
jgi:hypothetical protein